MGVRRGALCTPPTPSLYVYSFNSLHRFVEQKGDFVELGFLFLERTGLEDLGNSQRHLATQERSPRALWSLAAGPGWQRWLWGTAAAQQRPRRCWVALVQQGEALLPRGASISGESLILLRPLLLQAFVYPDRGLAEKVSRVWCLRAGFRERLERHLFPEQE